MASSRRGRMKMEKRKARRFLVGDGSLEWVADGDGGMLPFTAYLGTLQEARSEAAYFDGKNVSIYEIVEVEKIS